MAKSRNIDFSSLPVTHEATIPENYIDAMGHMNVAWYVRLFARGSRTIFHELGMNRE